MTRSLKPHHKRRMETLVQRGKIAKIDAYLSQLATKGFDVAGVPFSLLDGLIASDAPDQVKDAAALATHTVAGQPRLFRAILNDLNPKETGRALDDLVMDGSAHPMTRFEAMGWAVYLRHRANLPDAGQPLPDTFQFWDTEPPAEIQNARKLWARNVPEHSFYDDETAATFITENFDRDLAKRYASLWHPALKSDLLRLCRLARVGGLYADADSWPGPRVAEFVAQGGRRVWAAAMSHRPNCVTINGFLAAPPATALIEQFLEHVLNNLRNPGARGIFWLSGPGALTAFLYKNPGMFDIGLLSNTTLKTDLFSQFDAEYKQTDLNWRVYEHSRGLNNEAGLKAVLS